MLLTKKNEPADPVQASLGAVRALNRQPKSLRASEIGCVTSKLGGLTAGTPPIFGWAASHTAALGFAPSDRDDSIWKAGRAAGSFGS